ncbi:chorismate mutase [filamentous cyanobacterium LEGE 11480]|uniref:chorismate mutase n=1 Tax=Romeriopsis navalis LEGE 11480 TaxID=2777977 RepID=A0A928VRH4_9CYAN|nr:chorismate mutase [Romeriopsis navalis]MBE9032438.1 chorismate mutase [Romeriopsis navalis LEGE 11480]
MGWRVRAIRGATTVQSNSVQEIAAAVTELLDQVERDNILNLDEVVSVTFSVTKDLDAIFPAAIARQRPGWNNVPLLDVQQMYVTGSLERCIRILLHFNTPDPNVKIHHAYQRGATALRPDLVMAQPQ